MPVESTYRKLFEQLVAQQDAAGALSDEAAEATRTAFLNARLDIEERMVDLIERRGGLEALSDRDRWRLTRDTALVQNIERRLDELGVEHGSIVNRFFSQGGTLARGHVVDEIAAHLEQARRVRGDRAFLAAVNMAQLDTAAIELGLGRAVADTRSLSTALQVTVTQSIQQGVAAGEGIPALTRRLDVIPEISATRGEVISRWATIKGYNLARQAQYEAAASVIPGLKKQWLCAQDERTCEHCLAHHGETVEVAAEFDASRTYGKTPPEPLDGFLQTPPLHPRCRCTIVSWSEDWTGFTDITPHELEIVGFEAAQAAGFKEAALALPSETVVARSATGMVDRVSAALGAGLRGFTRFDDFTGTVRFTGMTIDEARLALRNAGFRVQAVAGADDLLRVDLPGGVPLPRMLRSVRLKALPESQWALVRERMLRCAKKLM